MSQSKGGQSGGGAPTNNMMPMTSSWGAYGHPTGGPMPITGMPTQPYGGAPTGGPVQAVGGLGGVGLGAGATASYGGPTGGPVQAVGGLGAGVGLGSGTTMDGQPVGATSAPPTGGPVQAITGPGLQQPTNTAPGGYQMPQQLQGLLSQYMPQMPQQLQGLLSQYLGH